MSVSERRVSDRRNETRSVPGPPPDPPQATMRTNPGTEGAVRDNPEVMGRTEPQVITQQRNPTSDIWPNTGELETRFMQIQSEFIEEPRGAVKKAERLIEEAIDQMTKTMHERMHSMHRDAEGDGDTEQLRLTMQQYREFIQSLGGHRAT